MKKTIEGKDIKEYVLERASQFIKEAKEIVPQKKEGETITLDMVKNLVSEAKKVTDTLDFRSPLMPKENLVDKAISESSIVLIRTSERDDWERPVYLSESGDKYVDIEINSEEPNIYSTEKETGEPLKKVYKFTIKEERKHLKAGVYENKSIEYKNNIKETMDLYNEKKRLFRSEENELDKWKRLVNYEKFKENK